MAILLIGIVKAQDTVFFKKAPTKGVIYKSIRYDGEFYYLEAMSKEFWETKTKEEDIFRIGYFVPPPEAKVFDPRTNDSLRTEEYILIVCSGLLDGRVIVTIDDGKESKTWRDRRITDENGEFIKFNSVIDALSFMNGLGWEFIAAYPMSMGIGQSLVYHYLMRRDYIKK